jgi:hypothetical protein
MICTLDKIIWAIKSRRMKWVEHVACKGDRKCTYGVFVVNAEGKDPLGKPGHRWMDTIKLDLQGVGWGAWTRLTYFMILKKYMP